MIINFLVISLCLNFSQRTKATFMIRRNPNFNFSVVFKISLNFVNRSVALHQKLPASVLWMHGTEKACTIQDDALEESQGRMKINEKNILCLLDMTTGFS